MSPLQLLVVDDSLADLHLITAAFEPYPDVHLTTHDQALVALHWLERHIADDQQLDLVLLDVHMPGMDGWAWLEARQQRSALHHIPVLLYSMTPMDWESQRIDSAQVCGCWQKPMSFAETQEHAEILWTIWQQEGRFDPAVLQHPEMGRHL